MLTKREATGKEVLNSSEWQFKFGVVIVCLQPLEHFVGHCMKTRKEAEQRSVEIRPDLKRILDAGSRSVHKFTKALVANTSSGEPWCVLINGSGLTEKQRMYMRSALLRGAAGLFMRVAMVFGTQENPWGELGLPFAMFMMPFLREASKRAWAREF